MNMSVKIRLANDKNVCTPPGQKMLLAHYILHTLPRVKKELQRWRRWAASCPDPLLRTQALNSLHDKDFHCYGGAVFALDGNGQEAVLIELITAYQTICDYLDNLCDRADCLDGRAFRRLHAALLDALQPQQEKANYYEYYPYHNDGGYLDGLITVCRLCLTQLSGYEQVQADILELVGYYIELQVKKHIDWEVREYELVTWAEAQSVNYEDLYWQEFAAASGSTLAVFALLALSSRGEINNEQVEAVKNTYYPWICGLHILLDYFIDQEEDRQGGDLNFTFYYDDEAVMLKRLKYFIRQSWERLSGLENPAFTRTVVEGLLAMYLSDRKTKRGQLKKATIALLNESGPNTWYIYRLCSLVRRFF